MKTHIGMLLILFSLFISQLIGYPTYAIGKEYKGIDTSTRATKNQYVFQDTVSSRIFEKTSENVPRVKYHDYKLYVCFEPKYLRFADEDGKTLWKTTTLFEESADGMWADSNEDPEDNKEYWVERDYNYRSNAAVMLKDKSNKQIVLKMADSSEVRLPEYLNQYIINDNTKVFPGKWLFLYYGDYVMYPDEWYYTYVGGKPLSMALVDQNGNIEWQLKTDIIVYDIHGIEMDETKTRMLIRYKCDKKGYQVRMLIISADGGLIRDYPDIEFDRTIHTFPYAPNYAMIYTNNFYIQDQKNVFDYETGKYGEKQFEAIRKATNIYENTMLVIDLRNGEIIAKILGNDIDLTQIDGSLKAVVSSEFKVAILDVYSGLLIQDFETSKIGQITTKSYDNYSSKISKDASEIWFCQRNSKSDVRIRHYVRK